jgi:hypothetical protein
MKLATWEAEIRRIGVRGQPGQIPSPNQSEKWTGGVAQTIECLLCKYEALNSNPSPTKKKKINKFNTTELYT